MISGHNCIILKVNKEVKVILSWIKTKKQKVEKQGRLPTPADSGCVIYN